MAKIVGQWDRQHVAAPSLNAVTEIFRHTSVSNSCFCFEGAGGVDKVVFQEDFDLSCSGKWGQEGV